MLSTAEQNIVRGTPDLARSKAARKLSHNMKQLLVNIAKREGFPMTSAQYWEAKRQGFEVNGIIIKG